MTDSDEFEFDAILDHTMTLRHLRAVLEGLEARVLELEAGQQSARLEVGEIIELRLKAKRKAQRAKLELQLQWRVPEGGAHSQLHISSGTAPEVSGDEG